MSHSNKMITSASPTVICPGSRGAAAARTTRALHARHHAPSRSHWLTHSQHTPKSQPAAQSIGATAGYVPAARMFEDLLAFIATLPFQHTGRIMVIFDDTYDHEAWNRTSEPRAVILLKAYHPELTVEEVGVLEMFAPLSTQVYRTLLKAKGRGA